MNEQLQDRADELKRRLFSPHSLLRVVGAHNVLGAQLIEQAGFDALWAGSLEITTTCGRVDDDSSILTDILPIARLLASRSRLPVIADGGTGADTPQGIAMLVRALERAGVAAVSLEDGLRPKSNSLLPGEHPLASVDEFAEKISAPRTQPVRTRRSRSLRASKRHRARGSGRSTMARASVCRSRCRRDTHSFQGQDTG